MSLIRKEMCIFHGQARLDLSFLEQHSRCVETEIKLLQEEHVKLNDQLRQAEVQFDDLLRRAAYIPQSCIIGSC
jgi:hypothetical protein